MGISSGRRLTRTFVEQIFQILEVEQWTRDMITEINSDYRQNSVFAHAYKHTNWMESILFLDDMTISKEQLIEVLDNRHSIIVCDALSINRTKNLFFQFKSTDFTFFVGAQCDLSGWCIDKWNKQLFIGVHGGEMWMTLQTACTRVWLKRFASFFASEAVSIWLTLLFVKRF